MYYSTVHGVFYIFAVIAVCSAVAVITARNPVRSVLSLVVTFFAMAGIWMELRAEFLSLILILVYVGAVMTLFLFVIMMLNIDKEWKQTGFVRYLPFGIIVIVLMTGLIIYTFIPQYFNVTPMPRESATYSNTAHIGMLLYTDYAYPFEIAGVLLLTAIIAAIALAYRGPIRRHVQKPTDQLLVSPKDRVRLLNIPTEPKQ